MEEPSTRALEQVIGNGLNSVFCSSGLILTQAMLGDKPVYRDNAKRPSKTAAFSASICATSFHISEVRCLAFDPNSCCFVHYDHDNYGDGWSRRCPSCIQGMKIRIRSSQTLESFAG